MIKRNKRRVKSLDITELSINFIEYFRIITGYNMERFLNYMNKSNAWKMIDDDCALGMINMTSEEVVDAFGFELNDEERNDMILSYKNNIKKKGSKTQVELDKITMSEYKNPRIIEMLMIETGISRVEAIKLWYNSRTKSTTLDGDMNFVSVENIYKEFKRELRGRNRIEQQEA